MMAESRFQFPDVQTLTGGLTSVFRANGAAESRVTILARKPEMYASSFASEIVTCRVNDGQPMRVFCKYGSEQNYEDYEAKRGVSYEALVYRHVLGPLEAGTPRLYGEHTDVSTGQTWLILECIDNTTRLDLAAESEAAVREAARWIGQFQRANEMRLSGTPMPFLITYDAEYYHGWARRTSLFAGHLHERFSWLAPLCQRASEFVTVLLVPPATIIHGEYTVHNTIVRGGTVYPVDWESAAIAAGEIDLASLTQGWPEIAEDCEHEYRRTRWPEGSPADFERRLNAARLYIQFRWLGAGPDWTIDDENLWRFNELHAAAVRLRLV